MHKIVVIPLFLFFLSLSSTLLGQSFYKERASRNHILSIGIGPSFSYMDNGGQYRSLDFEIKPSISASYTKKLNSRFDLRATIGKQWISSGGNPSIPVQNRWELEESAFTANGSVIYADVMPSMYLIAFGNHMNRSRVNLYGGLGLGILTANMEQAKSFNAEEQPKKVRITTPYIPLRAGLSFSLGPYSDIAGEGSLLFTFSDDLDGNANFNRYGDHLAQAQIVYRRYFIPRNMNN